MDKDNFEKNRKIGKEFSGWLWARRTIKWHKIGSGLRMIGISICFDPVKSQNSRLHIDQNMIIPFFFHLIQCHSFTSLPFEIFERANNFIYYNISPFFYWLIVSISNFVKLSRNPFPVVFARFFCPILCM